MVCIMQEYGEVVCCLGSTQNISNNAIFLQSDIRIALDPLVSTCCWSTSDLSVGTGNESGSMSVFQLPSVICGLTCAAQLKQQDKHCTALHIIKGIIPACVCQLPPPLGTSDVLFLFLSCFYFPLLSVSLLGKPSDSSIMKVPTGENLRFLPKKRNSTVWSPDGYGRHSDGLFLALDYLGINFPSYHRPVRNVSFAMASHFLWHDPDVHHTFYISDVPMATWLLAILWLIPLVFINEGIELHEIRMRVKCQKRQKLQFDTKLGMNSPF
ncbi:hypothetical protein IRJ41_004689 [Triplophysa rosa]|uniref:Uncharacterized protein n=1 Tax=Triplophysa rosa TaxID=992332 RepID=A0A9W7WYY0_TRIRA|nr:hypothetical protein IRJ41_004689 [Triplophysa rosa]